MIEEKRRSITQTVSFKVELASRFNNLFNEYETPHHPQNIKGVRLTYSTRYSIIVRMNRNTKGKREGK